MSILGILVTLFPLSVYVLFLLALYIFVVDPSVVGLFSLLAVLYCYPLISFRILNLFIPLKEGTYDLSAKKYNPWWGSYQFQTIYYVFPFLEGVLKSVPGLFSFWLRCWGSKIGKNVLWTPNVEVCDRPLMKVDDHVVIGHTAMFIAHIINQKEGKPVLYIKSITLGKGSFVGAGSKFGPGVELKPRARTKILTIATPDQVIEA
jgi:hypothetical protein